MQQIHKRPKLSVLAISRRLKVSWQKVKQWLRQPSDDKQHILQLYNRKSKQQHKFRVEHEELLRTYLQQHDHRKATVKQLKKSLIDKYPELAPMSYTSVRKLLKKKLNYSYKKAS